MRQLSFYPVILLELGMESLADVFALAQPGVYANWAGSGRVRGLVPS